MTKLYLLFASGLLMGSVFSMKNAKTFFDNFDDESQNVQNFMKNKQEKHRKEVRKQITNILLNEKRQKLIKNRNVQQQQQSSTMQQLTQQFVVLGQQNMQPQQLNFFSLPDFTNWGKDNEDKIGSVEMAALTQVLDKLSKLTSFSLFYKLPSLSLNLSNITLDNSNCSYSNTTNIHSILKTILTIPSLENIVLNLNYAKDLCNGIYVNICIKNENNYIIKCNNLNLELGVDILNEYHEKILPLLFKLLEKNKEQIKELDINLTNCNVSYNELFHLIMAIREITNLERLKLNLDENKDLFKGKNGEKGDENDKSLAELLVNKEVYTGDNIKHFIDNILSTISAPINDKGKCLKYYLHKIKLKFQKMDEGGKKYCWYEEDDFYLLNGDSWDLFEECYFYEETEKTKYTFSKILNELYELKNIKNNFYTYLKNITNSEGLDPNYKKEIDQFLENINEYDETLTNIFFNKITPELNKTDPNCRYFDKIIGEKSIINEKLKNKAAYILLKNFYIAMVNKIHLQIHPDYIKSFTKDFMEYFKNDKRFNNVSNWKICQYVSEQSFSEQPFPTVIIYTYLIPGAMKDHVTILSKIVGAIQDRYGVASNKIALEYSHATLYDISSVRKENIAVIPRYNFPFSIDGKSNQFIYGAIHNGDDKITCSYEKYLKEKLYLTWTNQSQSIIQGYLGINNL
jgi:hypothetical protein